MDSIREKIIKAVERVTALRRELDAAEQELDRLLPSDAPTKSSPATITVNLSSEKKDIETQIIFVPGSLPHRIYHRMTVNPQKEEFKSDDFADLGEKQNIRSALFRMYKTGKLKKVGHGLYAVAQAEDIITPVKFRKEDMLDP